jgi:hypothetical protein
MCLENRRKKLGRWMMMFESMIESILMYGAEIWGWKEQEEVEKVQGKCLREVLAMDRETHGIGWEWKRERERYSLKTKWMEGRSAGY